jgi:Zinc binding domain
MNKAFVREPDDDGRAYCPRCKSLGIPVGPGPLNTHIGPQSPSNQSRAKMHDAAWYCGYSHCEVAYFNQFDTVVTVDELKAPIYPYDRDAPLCACFGLTYDDVEADVRERTPTRIRELLNKSKTAAANCATLAADGRCCIGAVQELYMKLRSEVRTTLSGGLWSLAGFFFAGIFAILEAQSELGWLSSQAR